MQGIIIALEGLDGSGKTIQSVKLANTLLQLGYPVAIYKEPSDTITGIYLRQYLSTEDRTVPTAQAGLFLAAHAELMHQYINPDLDDGKVIILDRFIPSCVAYQCYIHGVPQEHLLPLYDHANGRETKYHTLLLDITPEESLSRTSNPDADSPHIYDHAPVVQRATTRRGYTDQASQNPEYWHIVDGHQPIPDVTDAILSRALGIITRHGFPVQLS